MNVEIIKEKSKVVNQLNNKIYVSDKYEDQVGSMVKIYRQSGQVVADANGLLIKNGSGESINWQLNVKDCMINTADSFIKYKVKYTLNCTAPAANNGTVCVPILNPEQQGATLCPGRYYVRDAILWCQPTILTATQDVTDFSTKEFAICQFPLNSANIIRRSQVVYGGKTMTDDDVCFETPLLQQQMSEEYQAVYNTQYFEQNVDNVLEFVNMPQKIAANALVPGTWTLPVAGAYTYVFYKTYTISLNLLNSVFDNQGRFYIIPDARSDPEIRIDLQPYSMAKLFHHFDHNLFTKHLILRHIIQQSSTGRTVFEFLLDRFYGSY